MKKKNLLPFIENEELYKHVEAVLIVARIAKETSEKNLSTNVIDPFSALFDVSCQRISFAEWMKQEKARQMQKTLQNAIGVFHQAIIGSMYGWTNLNTGEVADVVNIEKKIIAEIKNKYNTTKGNHKIKIYEDLKSLVGSKYKGYISYYVEIIPQGKKVYNMTFAPSDNKKHKRKVAHRNIRVIDGKSFYALATGYPDALKNLYLTLPKVIADIQGKPSRRDALEQGELQRLFDMAF